MYTECTLPVKCKSDIAELDVPYRVRFSVVDYKCATGSNASSEIF
jgi:hypothetical protein